MSSPELLNFVGVRCDLAILVPLPRLTRHELLYAAAMLVNPCSFVIFDHLPGALQGMLDVDL
eukprot:6470665-Amphidinium_carterae.4